MVRKKLVAITLIELTVVIAIIGILAAISYPSYYTYLLQSRRSDAINTLREDQLLVENYIYKHGITPSSSTDIASFISNSPAGFYTISYTQHNNSDYTLVATAINNTSQSNDSACTVISLTNIMDNIYPAACH